MIMELKFNNRLVEIPPFFEAYVEKGVKQGISQGELKHSRSTLERLVARAGIVLTDEQHKRIEACTDLAMLDRWTDNVSQAKTAAAVFGTE
jgi:hypothetical protein